jgi:hypothetical protein
MNRKDVPMSFVTRRSTILAGLAMTLLLLCADNASAQRYPERKFEITPFGGWFWSSNLEGYYGQLQIDDNTNYGVAVDIHVERGMALELLWSMSTLGVEAQEYPAFGGTLEPVDQFDLQTHYFQIGGVYHVPQRNIAPFFSYSVGAAYFHPTGGTNKEVTYQDVWRFAMSLGGGVKVMFSDALGLRLQGRLFMPMYFGGGTFLVGTGGAAVAVSSVIPVIQGDFTAGLIFAFGD